MKKIYLKVTPAYQETEEMIFTYAIYDEEDQLVENNELYHDYRKPVLASLFAVSTVLKELRPYRSEDLVFVVNDGALIDQLSGTTQTKNRDVLKVADLTRTNVRRFSDTVTFESVAGDHQRKLDWDKKLS